MSKRKNYLNIEKKIFTSLGKTGYTIIFAFLFSIVMCIVDFVLYCFVDNYFTSKFIFTGEIAFPKWLHLMWNSYSFPYYKIGFFTVILIAVGCYRSNTLTKEFSK